MRSGKVAWVQAALLIAVLAGTALALAIRLQQTFDRETLAIQVAQLQSGAAEAQLLVDTARADRLAPSFVRRHAQQMADRVDTTNDKLRKPAKPELSARKVQAQQLGMTLHSSLMLLARDGTARAASGFDATAQRLDALHRNLKPAD